MPSYISEKMLCGACEATYDDLLDRTQRDDAHECHFCGEVEARRTFTVPNVSTSKTSQSIPDVVAKGRFNEIRTAETLKRAKNAARKKNDKKAVAEISKEIQKHRATRNK